MVETAPKVAVIVINYNGKKWLNRCLSSLAKTTYPNYSVYLVDNASTDGSIGYVQASFPWVKIIRLQRNYGFARGNNLAIKQVEAEYAALLNNDTEILEKNWLEMLVSLAEKDNLIGAIACKIVFLSNPAILNSVGGFGIPYWRGTADLGYGERDEGQFDTPPVKPFSFCGGAALIRLGLFREAEGFDESFFAFFEDTDLCWRLRIMGYRIAYVPGAKVAHYYSGTWSNETKKTHLCKRNLFRSILKNCSGDVLLRWALPYHLLFTIMASISYLIVEHAPLMSWALLKSILWNVWHLKSTYGKRRLIQMARKSGDEEILGSMYPPGLARARLRNTRRESFQSRLADTIFGLPPKHWGHLSQTR